MTTFEEARQYLQKESSDGVSLYDHLSEVLLKVLSDKSSDASEAFEQISVEVKQAHYHAQQPVQTLSRAAAKAAQLKWAISAQALFAVPDEAPEAGPSIPDLLDQATLWAAAGVSFGQMETYRIYLAVKKLAETLPAEHEALRLWGRITCAAGHYLVVEGKTSEEDISSMGESFQDTLMEGTTGANRYTYWVTTGAGGPWTKLPLVTQKQIAGARKIRRLLTGNLNSSVPGYPPFNGNEASLLRAQIARITAGTCVSPSGFFEVDADAEPAAIKEAEGEAINEAFPKPIEDLASVDAWVHHELEINRLGRNRPLPEVEVEEGAPPVDEDPEGPVEEIAPLRSLAEDEPGSWGFRTAPAGAGAGPNSAVVAKSLLWPGAYAIVSGKRFTNIYVGTGVKYSAAPYEVPLPPTLLSEWAPPTEESEEQAAGEEDSEERSATAPLPPPGLLEQPDVMIDPTPPAEEEPEEEE